MYDDSNIPAGQPRKSWVMRSWQQREAVAEGLAEWQANPYFAAGRVTVPALLDTFACQSFFNEVRRAVVWRCAVVCRRAVVWRCGLALCSGLCCSEQHWAPRAQIFGCKPAGLLLLRPSHKPTPPSRLHRRLSSAA